MRDSLWDVVAQTNPVHTAVFYTQTGRLVSVSTI